MVWNGHRPRGFILFWLNKNTYVIKTSLEILNRGSYPTLPQTASILECHSSHWIHKDIQRMSNKVQSCHIFMIATEDQRMLRIHRHKLRCSISQTKGKVFQSFPILLLLFPLSWGQLQCGLGGERTLPNLKA